MAIFTGLAATNNTFTGTAAADVFRFAAADLNNLDIVTGGGGADLLQLTTAGVLLNTALSAVTGVEQITLAAGTNAVTVLDGNFTGLAAGARLLVTGNTGADTVDASGLTGVNAVDVTAGAGAGADVLKGGAGADLFRFNALDLTGDTVSGGAGSDTLLMNTAGTVAAMALANMTGVETIALANGTNSIALGDANFAGVASGRITVIGGSGNDTVTALTATSTNAIDVTAGAGNDTLTGSVGSDTFRFAAADLTSADTVQGSGGFGDMLQLTTAGVVGSLAGVTGVEQINLAAGGNQVDLFDANYAVPLSFGPTIFVNGASGSSIINASNLSASNAIVYSGGGGTDSVTSGSGADRFVYSNGRRFVAGSFLDGGGGTDTISFDRSMDFLGDAILGIEVLQSTSTAGVAVAISRENAAGFTQFAGSSGNSATDTFTVQLSAGSTTDLSNLTLLNRDAADAINVVSLGGAGTETDVVLSSSIARFTGGEGSDFVKDRGGVQAIVLGEGDDEVSFRIGNLFAAGDTIDGGGGDDFIVFDRSMDFLGDSITNVEGLIYRGSSDANVSISGENAARLRTIQNLFGLDGFTQIYTVQLSAGSTTDLSLLLLEFADTNDAIVVVSTGGNTAVTLNDQIARFTGSADADTVSLAPGVQYRLQSVIDGG